ncbi:hypothetical protein ACWC1C_01405 [Streptomyces sp. NPDC001705]
MTCRWHRWGPWVTEFEECPDGEMAVYEWRTRHCKRCNMLEESPRQVSATPIVLRLNFYYREPR